MLRKERGDVTQHNTYLRVNNVKEGKERCNTTQNRIESKGRKVEM